jgi:hypothetical protein
LEDSLAVFEDSFEESLAVFDDYFEVCSSGIKVVDGLSIVIGLDNESSMGSEDFFLVLLVSTILVN